MGNSDRGLGRWRLWVIPAVFLIAVIAILVAVYLGQNAAPGDVVPVS